jgi:hypothetical protein
MVVDNHVGHYSLVMFFPFYLAYTVTAKNEFPGIVK